MKRYVIIGNGVAAAGCIEGIRSTDTEGEITVISAEKHEVYCRPLISYYLEGKTDLTRMNYRGEDFYTKNEVRVIYGESATAINPDEHTVTVSDGSVLPYDAVCVAAGSSPLRVFGGHNATGSAFCAVASGAVTRMYRGHNATGSAAYAISGDLPQAVIVFLAQKLLD